MRLVSKKIAKIIGTSHNEVYFSYNNLEKLLNVLPSAYDEPFAIPLSYQHYY